MPRFDLGISNNRDCNRILKIKVLFFFLLSQAGLVIVLLLLLLLLQTGDMSEICLTVTEKYIKLFFPRVLYFVWPSAVLTSTLDVLFLT